MEVSYIVRRSSSQGPRETNKSLNGCRLVSSPSPIVHSGSIDQAGPVLISDRREHRLDCYSTHLDREVSRRRQNRDVTTPSKGLLPQLVEVLYALADSQERLTSRIRTAHVELLGVHPADGAGSSFRAPPLNPGGPAELPVVSTPQVPAREVGELFTSGRSGLSTESSADPGESTSIPGIGGSGAFLNDPEVVAPPNMPTEITTAVNQHDVSQQATPSQPDDLRARQDETTIERGDRSYNFFDELDARLADLRNAENASEETGS